MVNSSSLPINEVISSIQTRSMGNGGVKKVLNSWGLDGEIYRVSTQNFSDLNLEILATTSNSLVGQFLCHFRRPYPMHTIARNNNWWLPLLEYNTIEDDDLKRCLNLLWKPDLPMEYLTESYHGNGKFWMATYMDKTVKPYQVKLATVYKR